VKRGWQLVDRRVAIAMWLSGCSTAVEPAPRSTAETSGEEAFEVEPTEAFTLALSRRAHTGDRWRERSSTHGVTTERVPNGEPEVRERLYSIDADVEVVSADAASEVLDIVVREHVHRDWRTHDVDRGLAAGTRIRIEKRTGVGRLTRGGAPIPAHEVEILEEVLPLVLQPPDDNDDLFFGTVEPRRVGERWPMNLARLAAATGGEVEEAEMHFERIERCEYGRCAILRGRSRTRAPNRTSTLEYLLRVPLDPSSPIAEERRRIVAVSNDGRAESVYEHERTRTPRE
jgi:hypothetical protein